MSLLIVTQKVHKDDPVLGFFNSWLQQFADHYSKLTVIGQYCKDYDLPKNVTVHSLGKEKNLTRIAQVIRFWKLLILHRNDYDKVLVHMTPIWIVFGCPILFLFRKKMYLWYEAKGGGIWLKLSAIVCKKIFSASKGGMPIHTSKSVITGHGIDADRYNFSLSDMRDYHSLLVVGRITKAKQIEIPIQAYTQLSEEWSLRIAGVCITDSDRAYKTELRQLLSSHKMESRVQWSICTPDELIKFYKQVGFLLHASTTPLDKVVLEAMACGCIVLSTNDVIHKELPEICSVNNASDMAQRMEDIASWSKEKRQELMQSLRAGIVKKHSLSTLINRLVQEMS